MTILILNWPIGEQHREQCHLGRVVGFADK
jgi:hypothetical protein